MTLEEIGNLTIDNTLLVLLKRMDFTLVIPEGEYFRDEEGNINPNIFLPVQEDLETELAEYKAELEAKEVARLAEIERIKTITERFEAIDDIRLVCNISNPANELKRIIKEDDQEELSRLESEYATKMAEINNKAYMSKRKAEYPTIEELVVAMFEQDVDKIAELEAKRQEIKAKYPKS